jgi:hypothetical protein
MSKEAVMHSANEVRMTRGASPRHDEVELLAFQFWEERGAPIGTPEIDWFRAEAELGPPDGDADPALSAIAKMIGSAVGSMVAKVTPRPAAES